MKHCRPGEQSVPSDLRAQLCYLPEHLGQQVSGLQNSCPRDKVASWELEAWRGERTTWSGCTGRQLEAFKACWWWHLP
ncbi:hypothetical protein MC885_011630 [Smutsia gigantea]|nr:hypothetical protein MC885_011630 [Smutsia gigantea]